MSLEQTYYAWRLHQSQNQYDKTVIATNSSRSCDLTSPVDAASAYPIRFTRSPDLVLWSTPWRASQLTQDRESGSHHSVAGQYRDASSPPAERTPCQERIERLGIPGHWGWY